MEQLYQDLYDLIDSEKISADEFETYIHRMQVSIFYSDCSDDYNRGRSEIAETRKDIMDYIAENSNGSDLTGLPELVYRLRGRAS